MNEHYKNALVADILSGLEAEGIHATEEDVVTVLEEETEVTGNWKQDRKALLDACLADIYDDGNHEEDDGDDDKDGGLEGIARKKEAVEKDIDAILDSLKIGYNFIPGIGAGWCRNEEDLEKMKDFVRGALTAQALGASL